MDGKAAPLDPLNVFGVSFWVFGSVGETGGWAVTNKCNR